MSTKPLTTAQFFRVYPDDETCLQHLFDVRFGQGFTCSSCERSANWYRIKAERAYSCQWCGHHLHPTVGTPFEQTRTPLQFWFYAIHLFAVTRHGVSAKELQRQLGVTYKTAWRMAAKIREHMADVDGERPIGGPSANVEIDETLMGGVKKGTHNRGSAAKTVVVGGLGPIDIQLWRPANGGFSCFRCSRAMSTLRSGSRKTTIFDSPSSECRSALGRGGDIVAAVVPNQRRETLEPFVKANVRLGGNVHTDELRSYARLSEAGYRHARVNHGAEEYAYYDYRLGETLTTNGIEISGGTRSAQSTALTPASAPST